MVILGSGSIVSSLTRLGLIDEYEFIINPVVLGSGKSQFVGLDGRLKMKLLNAKTLSSGDRYSWLPTDEVEIVMTKNEIKTLKRFAELLNWISENTSAIELVGSRIVTRHPKSFIFR
jgi:dihydrofolate reductase